MGEASGDFWEEEWVGDKNQALMCFFFLVFFFSLPQKYSALHKGCYSFKFLYHFLE